MIELPLILRSVLNDLERKSLSILMDDALSAGEPVDFNSITWKEIRHQFKSTRINHHLGNIQISLPGEDFDKFDSAVNNKITNIANEISPGSYVKYFNITKISNKYGKPAMPPHIDIAQGVSFLIDVQVDGNFIWSKFVDGDPKNLENKDVLVFDSEDSVHWRSPKKLQDDQFLYLLCVYFSDNKEKNVSIISRSQKTTEALTQYKSQYIAEFNQEDGTNWDAVSIKEH
jgi:hypothetical protein